LDFWFEGVSNPLEIGAGSVLLTGWFAGDTGVTPVSDALPGSVAEAE
jgi:hypothetical protein